ncbi:MAG: serine protein kinase RIO [Candidatus Micrarchaeaceae archaeon]
MAIRVSKRKMPAREDFDIKERQKVEFNLNKRTMLYLSKFYNLGIISKLDFIIARGKESDIYIAEPGESDKVAGSKHIILKFFRIETSTFFNMADYINGDPRFNGIASSKEKIVYTWCKKEFGNLKMAKKAGVNVPMPYFAHGNILAMEFIGSNGIPAPQLKYVKMDADEAEGMLDSILENVRKLYHAGLVHADLSEYNILVKDAAPCIIDFGQAVVLRHPNAMGFLERDVRNILYYFKKAYGINKDFDESVKSILGE